ncbi:CPBP family intramembrane metalloprotease [Nocardiopsis sp. HNM0947]|uniref:CPBP family intramembrane metalloprotease n=1 Tax=Nocardiopsis coralli TaxID=2772213 RepID=A0ABR9PE15_9ACTN|nr:CPBP family glutamic-type intramembrane protease [Nocardiopsis coralli]MBE3001970.1 CPBP family intramembrane metalloprotease [Nocardiopsis coralli]
MEPHDHPDRSSHAPRDPRTTRISPRADLVRIAVLLLGFTLITAAAHTLAGTLSPGDPGDPGSPDDPPGLALRSAAALLLVLPLVWILCRTAGRTLRSIGLGTPARAWPPLVTAALACGATMALVVGAAVLTGNADLDSGPTSPASLLSAAGTVLLLTLLMLGAQILPEELVFRGYVQGLLGHYCSQLVTVLLQAALFTVSASLALGTGADLLGLALLGLFLGILRMASGGIWAGIGARTALTGVTIALDSAGFVFVSGAQVWNVALGMGGALAAYVAVRVLLAVRPGLVDLPGLRGSTGSRGGPDAPGDPAEDGAHPRTPLPVRGILYDVGSSYVPGQHSRERWNPDAVHEEMRVICEDLHCTAVSLFGHDLERMEQAARSALDHGLDVWLQPRSLDAGLAELVEHVDRAAELAQRLREGLPEGLHEQAPSDRIVLDVGCELTVINRGIIPGRHMGHRVMAMYVFGMVPFYYNRRLNRVLRRLAEGARARFDGPLTYGSGTWESVDWSLFDLVGVDYYFDEITRTSYRQGLRSLRRWGKPVVVTEFGCCAYRGAETKGGGGADVLDWRDLDDRKVRGKLVRDEGVQADMVERLLDVYETEEVHGAFLCMFIEGDCRYSPDPVRDCDMASFGIVRPPALETGLSPDDGHWEPKEAFHALARRYATADER